MLLSLGALSALSVALTLSAQQRPVPGQPGATQGGPTGLGDSVPRFNMDYFVGQWTFEWTVPDTPLGTGGKLSGSETIRRVWDGRFYEIAIKGEGPDGPFTGNGVMTYLDTPAGQHATRYEVTRGIAILKSGTLGGDLGGTYSHFWETPPIERNGKTIRLKGRSYMTSPAGYKVTTEISIDKGAFQNMGTMWYAKAGS